MCQIQKGEAIFKLAVWVYTKFLICSNLVVLIRSPHLVTKQKKLKPHRWKLLIVHVLQYMRFSFSPISVYIFHISKLIKLPQNKSEKNTHCIQLQVIISIKNGRQQPSLTSSISIFKVDLAAIQRGFNKMSFMWKDVLLLSSDVVNSNIESLDDSEAERLYG